MNAQEANHIGYPYQRYQRASLPRRTTQAVMPDDEEEDDVDETMTEVPVTPRYRRSPHDELRSHTSALRYPRPSHTAKETVDFNRQRERASGWMLFVGIGLLVMLIGWIAVNFVLAWWQGVQEDWTYGHPRTFQTDQYVGHDDSPDHPNHFIAVNLHGMIEVIEINLQHPDKDHVYIVTTLDNENVPVALRFTDTNHDGKPDMVIAIGESTPYTVVWFNSGHDFQPHP
ncbi:MAG TPA: hypothetical protein VFA41_04875 [Ktedonobacteraceae bacterium]|jgi:hypothetical protein|nr:hypothetical protein [Ktedonobacteraceae bacterium]